MARPRQDLLAGVRDIAPMLPGIVPFGAITGAAMVAAGIPEMAAVALSLGAFAGASQLAATDLIARGAPAVVVVLAALVVNLRFTMFSASLAPHFQDLPRRWTWPLSSLIVDTTYAVSITRFSRNDVSPRWYFLGAGLVSWVTWQSSTVVGVFLGARVPAAWHLEFAVPLIFIALLVTAVEDRSTALAGVTAGLVAIGGVGLPFNLGLPVAALCGILVGRLAAEVTP